MCVCGDCFTPVPYMGRPMWRTRLGSTRSQPLGLRFVSERAPKSLQTKTAIIDAHAKRKTRLTTHGPKQWEIFPGTLGNLIFFFYPKQIARMAWCKKMQLEGGHRLIPRMNFDTVLVSRFSCANAKFREPIKYSCFSLRCLCRTFVKAKVMKLSRRMHHMLDTTNRSWTNVRGVAASSGGLRGNLSMLSWLANRRRFRNWNAWYFVVGVGLFIPTEPLMGS